MSIVSEAQQTYIHYTKQEYGNSLNVDNIHRVSLGLSSGERMALMISAHASALKDILSQRKKRELQ